ncbi:protein kinase [Archangium violaceum]|uniref:serine/threonine protein kinase n=1 Tax=Archangium violaceum TaxID=83451 RepID=UPI00194EE256|nr:protein kinase [Archangium violaceum]QRN99231.1 protein kinase [Archangium violaceum]
MTDEKPMGPSWGEGLEDLGELGQGGMARVRRARDTRLRRELAVKVLAPELAENPEAVRRFQAEAQVTAQLEHPHVPPVHEMGLASNGDHYFSMRLVEGSTLDVILRDPDFDVEDEARLFRVLQVFLKVCDAVAFAHSRGVVHCDLKPSNIMVGSHGQVYVMDWGISLLNEMGERPVTVGPEERRSPRTGNVMGTPGYMAPEQARGHHQAVNARTDIFALGAILYRILTGRRPYSDSTGKEAYRRSLYAEVTPPEQMAPDRRLPRWLCAIAMRALSFGQEERHPRVESLQEDVESYIRGVGRYPLRAFGAGQVIVREGEKGERAYVIHRGRCVAYKLVGGRRQVLREMGPGDIFGETAIFASQVRTATVEALEETVVSEVGRDALEQELQMTFIMNRVVRSLARRFHDVDRRTSVLAAEVDAAHLAREVLLHLNFHGTAVSGEERTAPWRPLCERLVRQLGLSAEQLATAVRAVPQVSLDEASDCITLRASEVESG